MNPPNRRDSFTRRAKSCSVCSLGHFQFFNSPARRTKSKTERYRAVFAVTSKVVLFNGRFGHRTCTMMKLVKKREPEVPFCVLGVPRNDVPIVRCCLSRVYPLFISDMDVSGSCSERGSGLAYRDSKYVRCKTQRLATHGGEIRLRKRTERRTRRTRVRTAAPLRNDECYRKRIFLENKETVQGLRCPRHGSACKY